MTSKQVAKRGPKSHEGKLVAAMNSTKHGILSPKPVVSHFESESAWKKHRDSILESLDPQGGVEQALAERVALNSWRLNRVVVYETEQVRGQQEKDLADAEEETARLYERYMDLSRGRGDGPPTTMEEAAGRVQRAEVVYEDVKSVYSSSEEEFQSYETAPFFYEKGPYNAAEVAAERQAVLSGYGADGVDIVDVEVHADRLEAAFRKRTGEEPKMTGKEMLSHVVWLAKEAGIPDEGPFDPHILLLDALLEIAEGSIEHAKREGRELVERYLSRQRRHILPNEAELTKISRYEAHLSREMYRALHELEALQKRRAGEPTPLARIDVQGVEAN
jgi:hypothetical protein